MSGYLQPVCVLAFAGILFSSCYTLSMYNQSRYAMQPGEGNALITNRSILLNDVPACAMRQLLRRFPEADNITWKQFATSGWVAGFTTSTLATSMYFNDNGNWTRIYQTYADPPQVVVDIVSRKFTDYDIVSVNGFVSVVHGEHFDFNIVIRNKDNRRLVGLCNGEMVVNKIVNP